MVFFEIDTVLSISPGKTTHTALLLIAFVMLPLTKITMPSLSDIVPRERLFSLLDERLKKPVTWIASPGGSGKTTLVGNYLNVRRLSYLWYKIDPGDSDLATFFYFMGIASQECTSRSCEPMPLLMPEYLSGIQVFTQRYFEELYRRLPRPFVFVFDNCQEVSSQSQLHEILFTAISATPVDISTIIISRVSPAQHFSRLRANNKMGIVGWNDIRLTENETRKIVGTKHELILDDSALSQLHARSEGWVAGLVLLMEGITTKSFECWMEIAVEHSDIFKYFVSEALGKMAPEMQTFLLRTSFLPTMTVPMAQTLTGINTAGRILQDLHEHNYFTERRFGDEPVYLYHSLFRGFLNARAREVFTDDEIAAVKRNAATLLMNAGQAEDAATLLIQAGDWNAFVPFVLEHAPALMSQGRSKTLVEWLAAVPEQLVGETPWVLYWKGVCVLSSSPTQSRVYFEQAFHLFEGRDEIGVFLAWSGAVNTFLYEFTDFELLDNWISWLDARMRVNASFPNVEIEARVAASMTGALIWRKPGHPDMVKWLHTALTLTKNLSDTDSRIRAYLDISLYYLWMGEITEGALLIDQIKKLAAVNSTSAIMAISAKHAEALFLNANIAYAEKALQTVADGLKLSSETGVHVMDMHFMAHGVQSSINAGKVDMMRKYLMEMERMIPWDSGLGSSLFFYLSAWLNLFLDDAPRAVVFGRKSIQMIEQVGIPFPEALNRVVTAIALCGAGNYDEAIHQLQMIAKINSSIGSLYLEYLNHLILSHVEFSRNNDSGGLKALRRAMEVGRQKDDLTAMTNFLRPDSMARLCAKALSAEIEAEHVQALIKKLRLVPDHSSTDLENWPWSVRIYTLGRFSLIVNGKVVQDSGKAQKKPLLLLKALIALGGRDVKAETLTDILWPEADGDSGHNAFTTTLARLRRMVGNDRAIQLYDGRVTVDNRHCWVDMWVFERLCNQTENSIEKALDGYDPTALKAIISKTTNLYRGHFLRSDAEESWTVMPRERLRRKYQRLLLKIGLLCEQTGADEEAVAYYRKGLETDLLAEELYQRLISSLIRLGRLAEAMITYQQCRDVLKAEFGIAPSLKTEALKNKIYSTISALTPRINSKDQAEK